MWVERAGAGGQSEAPPRTWARSEDPLSLSTTPVGGDWGHQDTDKMKTRIEITRAK